MTQETPLLQFLTNKLQEDIDSNRALGQELTVTDSHLITTDHQARNDSNTARDALLKSLTRIDASIEFAQRIAHETMDPKAFLALANLLKIQTEITDKLMKIHADQQKFEQNSVPGDERSDKHYGDTIIQLFRDGKQES